MLKNKEIINRFLDKDFYLQGSNLHSYQENKLINYYTCIAQWFGDMLVLNITKYSPTTSKNQNILYSTVEEKRILYTTVNNIPIDTDDLTYYYHKQC